MRVTGRVRRLVREFGKPAGLSRRLGDLAPRHPPC